MKSGTKDHIARLEEEEKALEEAFYGKEKSDAAAADGKKDDEFFDPSTVEDGTYQLEQGSDDEVSDDDEDDEVEVRAEESEVVDMVDDTPEDVVEDTKPKRISWKKKFEELDKRYRNYRASYDAKTFQLRSKVGRLVEQNKELSKRLDKAMATIANTAPTQDIFASVISDEEAEMIGPEAVEVMKRMALQAAEVKTSGLRDENRELRTRLDQQDEDFAENLNESAHMQFKARLASVVPEFDKIDRDPRFMDFLNRPDPVNGETNFYWFKKFQEQGNVTSVAAYFKKFLSLINKPAQTLERHITPTANRSTVQRDNGVTQNPKVEFIKLSEYLGFLEDVRSGVYEGRLKEAQKLERRYEKAYNEGRIIE